MSTRHLDKLFNPQRVALLGASNQETDPGFHILRNLLSAGFRGVIYPLNPATESVQGIQSYASIAALPHVPDLAVICLPAAQVPQALEQCGAEQVPAVAIISAGFREKDQDGHALEEELRAIHRCYRDMRVLGPNSLGIISPHSHLNASFTRALPRPGHLALLSHSGALGNAILDRAEEKGIGLAHFVSLGNMLDINFGDLIDYFGIDYRTRSIILYLQSIDDPRNFMSAARACAKQKPIVAYKSGRFAESARAAASHTGAMVAEDAVYEAAFQRAGIVRAMELDDIFDVAELLACQRLPKGDRLAIVSNSGGAAVVAADALLTQNGRLAKLQAETLDALRAALPEALIEGNPVDITDEAMCRDFAEATRLVAQDSQVDAVLVVLTPQVTTRPGKTAKQLAVMAKTVTKPVLAAWMGGQSVRKGIRLLNEAGFPTHASPEHAVRAFMHLVSYARNLEILYETPRDIPVDLPLNRREMHQSLSDALLPSPGGPIDEALVYRLLETYGIPVCETRLAHSLQEAQAFAAEFERPVALKILAEPPIIHKTDISGISLNLSTPQQIEHAYACIMNAVRDQRPDVKPLGVLVQPMQAVNDGLELILGAKKDPTFGAVIMVGLGGVTTGIYQDRALGLPPLNERLAWHMLESLHAWPLLRGYRGLPPVNLDRLLEVMMRFSYLVADYPEFSEIDINPLLVTADGVLALDAAMLLEADSGQGDSKPYQHLAIRPYPEEYVRHALLKNGVPVTLRPIRPEDEPQWQDLLQSASPESIRFRFRSLFKHVTHEMASRHCYIDYEREISIVGEIELQGRPCLIGVGGLSAEAEDNTAEFAVLVTDAWQGKGLGGMLLDYCLEIAGNWGVKRIIAETDPQNRKMLTSFRKRGFISRLELEDDVVYLYKEL